MVGASAELKMTRFTRQIIIRVSLSMVAALAVSGCTDALDSWADPSVVGRWEYTPTVVPILDRIDVIEEDTGEYVETSEIMPEDLIPEPIEYEIGAGDSLTIEIFDFLAPNVPSQFQRVVDGRGNLDLPQIGAVNIAGLTARQVEAKLAEVLREKGIIQDALVTVQAVGQRDATFTIYGAVGGVGRYIIAEPDYRLLDALTEAGGIPPATPNIFVIRQIPLTEEASRGKGVEPATPPAVKAPQPDKSERGTRLEDLIEKLTKPEEPPSSPAVFSSLPQTGVGGSQPSQAKRQPQQPPVQPFIDLPESRPASPTDALSDQDTGGNWVFLNGEWVRVTGAPERAGTDAGLAEGPNPLSQAPEPENLMTQRVIKVPVKPLLQGNAAYNIVIRPGDRVRVPPPVQGFVYVVGTGIARPGVYNLPAIGRLTLTKSVLAAGGLSPIGIPNRTDLTRMVGPNRQATIRLNLKSIFEGSEPDVFLKPDDVVNVGTTWWAQPLAIIRNGFRMTYGFGFLLDRNFGNDVFGPPPFSRRQ